MQQHCMYHSGLHLLHYKILLSTYSSSLHSLKDHLKYLISKHQSRTQIGLFENVDLPFFFSRIQSVYIMLPPPKTKSLGLVNDVVGHQSISKISELSMDNDNGAIEREPILKFTWRNTIQPGGSLICIESEAKKKCGQSTTTIV